MTEQSGLGDFGADVPEAEEETEDEVSPETSLNMSREQIALMKAPETAEPENDLSCPWCLESPDNFVTKTSEDTVGKVLNDRQVSCGYCGAVIPTDAEWYLNGEKVCY